MLSTSPPRDFKVIDNKMGNVRVNSDLQIAGELRAPRVEGELGVDDRHRSTSTRSSRRPATRRTPPARREYLTKPERMPPAQAGDADSPFDALQDGRASDRAERSGRQGQQPADAGRADRPRRAERDARRRCARDQAAGIADRACRHRQHGPRHLRFPGPAVRDPARRQRSGSTAAGRDRSGARHPDAPAHSGGRGARQRPRHASSSRKSS